MTEKELKENAYILSSKINYCQDIDGTGFIFSIDEEKNKYLLNFILPILIKIEDNDYQKMIKLVKINLDKIPVYEWEIEEVKKLKEWIDSSFIYSNIEEYVNYIKTNNQNKNNKKITIGNNNKILI